MDIRQSPEYANFMDSIGWQVEKAGKWNVFIKKFPLIGSLIKIQRISPPIPYKEIDTLAQKHHSFKTIIEFAQTPHHSQIPQNFKVCHSPFLPTKTILIDLKRPENEIFDSFSPEKRRSVRKAQKNRVIVKEGNAEEFIFLKRKSLLEKFILPIGDRKDILALNKAFSPNICFLIAYSPNPVAGILLLFHQKTAYYWQAASLNKGKKLSAPSFLVWEALKHSKQKGCQIFDFEGIYDERFPNSSWKGFTKFKQGFGGKEVIYREPLASSRFSKSIFIFPTVSSKNCRKKSSTNSLDWSRTSKI